MITWIQTYFQKHFRTIFTVLLGVVIISFVFSYNASGGFGRSERQAAERPFFHLNLNNEQDVLRMEQDAKLSAGLRQLPIRYEEQLKDYAKTRVAGAALADELHLPMPTEKEISAFVASLPIFQKNGGFDSLAYSNFADSLKNNPQFKIADVNRVFRDDTRLVTLGKLLGGPGYVLPGDVSDLLGRMDAWWSIAVASLDFASYDPAVTVTDEALQKFFGEYSASFQVDERKRLSVVEFKAAEFAPTGPIPDDQLRAFYNSNLKDFPAPAEPAGATPAAPVIGADNFEKVRAKVDAALRSELGSRTATKAATDFSVALYEAKTRANSPELAAFLAAQKRTAIALAPFNQENPPTTLPLLFYYYGREFAALNQQNPVSDALPSPTRDGAFLLLWNETLPSYQPAFAEVREKVAAAYKENEKRKRFAAEGQALSARLAAAVKAGTAFEKAAAEAKLEVKSYANFTMADTPQDLPDTVRQSLGLTKPGEVSPMSSNGEKGYITFVAQKQAPDLSPANPRYVDFRNRLMTQISAATGLASIQTLALNEEARTAPPALPPAPGAAK